MCVTNSDRSAPDTFTFSSFHRLAVGNKMHVHFFGLCTTLLGQAKSCAVSDPRLSHLTQMTDSDSYPCFRFQYFHFFVNCTDSTHLFILHTILSWLLSVAGIAVSVKQNSCFKQTPTAFVKH